MRTDGVNYNESLIQSHLAMFLMWNVIYLK